MNSIKTAVMLAIVILAGAGQVAAQHYYSGGRAIPLQIDSSRVTIVFAGTIEDSAVMAFAESVDGIVGLMADDLTPENAFVFSLANTAGYGSLVNSLEALESIRFVEPYYMSERGEPRPVGDRFCVGFDPNLDRARIDSINALYGVAMERELRGMDNIFVLRNTPASGCHILHVANNYYDLEETYFSHPVFKLRIVPEVYTLVNKYHPYQDHIKKVIGEFNTASVWDFGGLTDSIVVSVIDDGIADGIAAHLELPESRVLPGWDFVYDNPDASPEDSGWHGMACAGIIAAEHHTGLGFDLPRGMISLNPHARILPIKTHGVGGWDMTDVTVAEAIVYAVNHGADILSCSWSLSDASDGWDNVNAALQFAIDSGRGGLGCPMFFAAGNAGAMVKYPANHSTTFAIGAIELDDTLFSYSCVGWALDLVAPSGWYCLQGDVWTLDQNDGLGANPLIDSIGSCPPIVWDCDDNEDYNCRFGGTSAATPIVSGAASLLLSRFDTLHVFDQEYWNTYYQCLDTADGVYSILRKSAVTELDWGTITPPDYQYG